MVYIESISGLGLYQWGLDSRGGVNGLGVVWSRWGEMFGFESAIFFERWVVVMMRVGGGEKIG